MKNQNLEPILVSVAVSLATLTACTISSQQRRERDLAVVVGVFRYISFAHVWYTQIRLALSVFGPLLMEPLLHKRGRFDSHNQYMNCISKKMYCVLFLCIQQMNGCEPPISGHVSFTSGTLQ